MTFLFNNIEALLIFVQGVGLFIFVQKTCFGAYQLKFTFSF